REGGEGELPPIARALWRPLVAEKVDAAGDVGGDLRGAEAGAERAAGLAAVGGVVHGDAVVGELKTDAKIQINLLALARHIRLALGDARGLAEGLQTGGVLDTGGLGEGERSPEGSCEGGDDADQAHEAAETAGHTHPVQGVVSTHLHISQSSLWGGPFGAGKFRHSCA